VNEIEFAGFSERGDEPPQGKEFNSPVMSVNSIRHAESTGSKNVYYLFFLFDGRSCNLAKSCSHYLNRRVLCDFTLSFQEDRGGGGGRFLIKKISGGFGYKLFLNLKKF
jgi:hypothetical protein